MGIFLIGVIGRYLGDVHFALEVAPNRPSLTDPAVMFINWKRYSQLGKILGGRSFSGIRLSLAIDPKQQMPAGSNSPLTSRRSLRCKNTLDGHSSFPGHHKMPTNCNASGTGFSFLVVSSTHTCCLAFSSNHANAMIYDKIHGPPTYLALPGTSRLPELPAQLSKCRPVIDSPNDHFNDPVQTVIRAFKPRSPLACTVQVRRKYLRIA